MSITRQRWQKLLERFREGLKREGLAPMPAAVERSLEHAYVAGMVAYRCLVFEALAEGEDDDLDAMKRLDLQLVDHATSIKVLMDDWTH